MPPLMPVAALTTLLGVAIVKRLRAEIFYPMIYALVFLLSIKLMWDGAVEFW